MKRTAPPKKPFVYHRDMTRVVSGDGLKIGSFYWVQPLPDERAEEAWENDKQPMRFAGIGADGAPLWNMLKMTGSVSWPMIWLGPEIAPTSPGHEPPRQP